MTDENQTPIVEQRDSIKLIKNTKGINYELKIYRLENEAEDEFFKRLDRYHSEAKKRCQEDA